MERHRDHIRNRFAGRTLSESSEKVLSFRRTAPASANYDAGAAVDLVYQAAEMVRSIQNRTTQREARAEDLVESKMSIRPPICSL
jgi:hypothetical protein